MLSARVGFSHHIRVRPKSALGPGHVAAETEDVRKGSIFFVGTATTIIRWGGITILTDPNFLHKGDHVHLGPGIYAERLTNPAIDLEELPHIDVVDHFDTYVQQHLDKTIPIITTSHAAENLRALGFQHVFPLKNWEKAIVSSGGVTTNEETAGGREAEGMEERREGQSHIVVTSMPGQHAPTGLKFALPPVMGSMLEFATSKRATDPAKHEIMMDDLRVVCNLYISGDTLVIDDLKEIPKRFPDIDIALIHLGGTTLLGMFLVTMDGKQGVECIQIVRPHTIIPIHYNDYDLFKSPLDDFKKEVEKVGLVDTPDRVDTTTSTEESTAPTAPEVFTGAQTDTAAAERSWRPRFVYLNHGETYEFTVPKSRFGRGMAC
ncbi:hypothetical protein HK102_005015 [Quaeritorhiza haematococci]|nr:hypothetical protein HK102_005015 [Quaeritorhiza haematococci]